VVTPTPASNASSFFGESRCSTAGVLLCEDFENGTISNNWSIVGSKVEVGTGQFARGARALHITKAGSGPAYILEKTTFPAMNNTYYGRAFFYFTTLPKAPAMSYSHWTLVGANGTQNPGEIRLGGQFQNGKNLYGVGTDSTTGDWTTVMPIRTESLNRSLKKSGFV
jgi:hypothetical protein